MPEDQPAPVDPTDALRTQLAAANTRLVQAELRAQATAAGMIDLDCLRLLDLTAFRHDDQGNIPEAKAALANLKREKPWMFAKPNSSHPAPPPAAEPPAARMARDMTYREWQVARERLIKGR